MSVSVVSGTKELLGFTGEGSVVDLHLGDLVQDEIGGDEIALVDVDDVAWHQKGGLDLFKLAIAHNHAHLGDEVLEIVHQVGSLGGLGVGEASGDEHDECEHASQVQIGLVLLGLLDGVSDEAKGATEPQKQREETSLLLQEHNVSWSLLLVGKAVGATNFEEGVGGIGGQAVLDAGLELFLETLAVPHVVLL